MLDELKYALDHLPLTVPNEIIKEGSALHQSLSENPEAGAEMIHDALVLVGKKEYPYRKAYQQMVKQVSEDRHVELVLEHLEPEVKTKVQHLLENGVTLEALVKSSMFETDFTAEERYQVEDGMLHAADHVQEELPEKISADPVLYQKLVEEWGAKQAKIQEKIEELRLLAQKDDKWKEEILDKVKTLEEGWSITERDPELLEVEKEIEYWQGTMEE